MLQKAGAAGRTCKETPETGIQATLTSSILINLLETGSEDCTEQPGSEGCVPASSLPFLPLKLPALPGFAGPLKSRLLKLEINAVANASYPRFPTRNSKKRHMLSQIQAPRLAVLVTSSESHQRQPDLWDTAPCGAASRAAPSPRHSSATLARESLTGRPDTPVRGFQALRNH